MSLIVIVLVVLFSGCIGGQEKTPEPKELPEFQQFLKEHPNAKMTITYWSKEEVEKAAHEIGQQCDKPITPVSMYKATASDEDLKIVSWINEENKKVVCLITESKGSQTNISVSNPTPQFTPISPTVSSIPTSVEGQKTFNNSIGMEFVMIPAGEFDMGSPELKQDKYSHEGPVHRVKIKKAFYMGKYEVTQKQWREIMFYNPSFFRGDNLPINVVSWNDIQEFIKKLNEKEGTNKYRLPSEAEWEYAARAGTTTRYFFGDDESKLGDYAWYWDNSGSEVHEVGQKKPNPWGLYDIYGNVWEWVQDIYHGSYDGAPADGSAWITIGNDGPLRVFRGGMKSNSAYGCRSASRYSDLPSYGDGHLGFRLVRDL